MLTKQDVKDIIREEIDKLREENGDLSENSDWYKERERKRIERNNAMRDAEEERRVADRLSSHSSNDGDGPPPGHPMWKGTLSDEEHAQLVNMYTSGASDVADPEMPAEIVLWPAVVVARKEKWKKLILGCAEFLEGGSGQSGLDAWKNRWKSDPMKFIEEFESNYSRDEEGNWDAPEDEVKKYHSAGAAAARVARDAQKDYMDYIEKGDNAPCSLSIQKAIRHGAHKNEDTLSGMADTYEHWWRQGKFIEIYGQAVGHHQHMAKNPHFDYQARFIPPRCRRSDGGGAKRTVDCMRFLEEGVSEETKKLQESAKLFETFTRWGELIK